MRRTGIILPIGSAALCIAAAACGGDDSTRAVGPEKPDTAPLVRSIELNPPARRIGILGTRVGIRAAALTEDGEMLYGSHLDPGRFSWSSSDPDVATLDEATHPITGGSVRRVTGMSEGTATITATSQGLTGSMTVTVRDRARVAWSLPVGTGAIPAGVAIGVDGTIYVVSSQYGESSHLLALSPQGRVVWTLLIPFRVSSIPAIGDDGTLYLGSRATVSAREGRLFAVDPGGTVRWVLEDLNPLRASPALGPEGILYVAGGRHIYAIDPQGEIRWTYETAADVFFVSSPAVASDGTFYVGGEDGLLYAIGPDGSLRWTFATEDRIRSSPSIGSDGTIYFGSHDGRLYAVDPDGTERWRLEVDWRGVTSSPSIGPDGTIYVMSQGVLAVDPDGSVRWSYRGLSHGDLTTPILGADGTVYIVDGGGVNAFDPQGRLLWDYGAGRHIGGSPAIGVEGTIFATSFSESSPGSFEGTVHAIVENGSTNGGFAGSPWPTARGDRANSGRAGG